MKRPLANSYTELQVTSCFSFLRGASKPEELVERASELGYRAIALTDWNSLAGVVRAHSAAKKLQIPLIIGCRISLFSSFGAPEPISLLLYPTNRLSYGALCELLTLGKMRAEKGLCFLTLKDIERQNSDLLAVVIVDDFTNPELISLLRRLKNAFGLDRLSIALTETYGPDGAKRKDKLFNLSSFLRIPLVATNDVYYHAPQRKILQDVLSCIRLGRSINSAGFLLFQNAERFLKPAEEMMRLFSRYPRAINRAGEIADCALNFSLSELRYNYPKEIHPPEKTPLEYLAELTFSGARERYPQGIPPKVLKQIEHELKLIGELDYAKYFLTVYDIVRFACSRGILCQGRGAAANSAVCYCLGVTAVDPDKIRLLVERFISKERNEPPDIDIDFEHERREEVIQYIYNKYGRRRAALVCEVITYRNKSAVRDIGKVFELQLSDIERIQKLISRSDGGPITPSRIRRWGLNPQDPAVAHTILLSQQLIGFPRHLSQHVGGFIISEEPLSQIVPIENAAMPERTVIEWDKNDIEELGMLKIDILALGMLTCIRKAFSFINQSGCLKSERPLLLYNVPPEDKAVYDMLSCADSIGVFQVESRAQMSMLPRLKPRSFYDLVIEVAIVRPGPIQGKMVHPYLRRRNRQEKVSYPNQAIREILERTLGVPIFQEQVMELAVAAAGFSPGEADELRRAIAGWREKENLIKSFRQRIVSGMLSNGYKPAFAKQVFEQIQGFGEYGFPQSHAASFALLVYVSAWLKRHYPAVFAAALLNSQPMGFYQPAQIVEDAKRHKVRVLRIDVNKSSWDCSLEDGISTLRLGMRLVKGLSKREAEKVSRAVKGHGAFTTITGLWRRSGVRIDTLRILARADAFGSMQLNRQHALWVIRKFRDAPLPLLENCQSNQVPANLPPTSAASNVFKDYETTGLSLKAHPVSFFRKQLSDLGAIPASGLKSDKFPPGDSPAAIAGLVLVRQRPLTASGIVFMTIEDETGMANIIIKPPVFKRYREIICDSSFVLVSGTIQRDSGVVHLIATSFLDLESGQELSAPPSRDFH